MCTHFKLTFKLKLFCCHTRTHTSILCKPSASSANWFLLSRDLTFIPQALIKAPLQLPQHFRNSISPDLGNSRFDRARPYLRPNKIELVFSNVKGPFPFYKFAYFEWEWVQFLMASKININLENTRCHKNLMGLYKVPTAQFA